MTPKNEKIGPVCDRRVWLEQRAVELSKHCPADLSNPSDCPLCGLRPLSARARRIWIQKLTDKELEYMATYHGTCYAEKIATGSR